MKKGIYIINVFATFWCGVLVSNISKVKNNRCKTNYVYIGEKPSNIINFRGNIKDISYVKDYDPLGVYNQTKGMIESPEMAYTIADCILAAKYGRKEMDDEKPYSITLLGGRFWVITGTLKSAKGGVAHIVLKKDDGQIQTIYHDK